MLAHLVATASGVEHAGEEVDEGLGGGRVPRGAAAEVGLCFFFFFLVVEGQVERSREREAVHAIISLSLLSLLSLFSLLSFSLPR